MPTSQQQIDYGNVPNDGQGDPLRTAFVKTDDNFDAIWNAGPVGSNITIINSTIAVQNPNGDLTLRPNGIGVIRANSAIVPNSANLRDLGTANLQWRRLYVQDLSMTDLALSGDATIAGNLTVQGDVITDPVPLANLTAVSGARTFVSDGNLAAAGNFGAQIGPGGANIVPVWSDGSNWYIG